MIRSVAIVVRWGELIAALAIQRCVRPVDTSLTMGSALVEPSARRAASLGNDGTSAVRAAPRLDLHPAVAGEERSERIPRAMRPSLCGHGAVALLAVHDTAHLRGHRVPAYRANSGSKSSGCQPRELVEDWVPRARPAAAQLATPSEFLTFSGPLTEVGGPSRQGFGSPSMRQ
jgi:hypothetical protein